MWRSVGELAVGLAWAVRSMDPERADLAMRVMLIQMRRTSLESGTSAENREALLEFWEAVEETLAKGRAMGEEWRNQSGSADA